RRATPCGSDSPGKSLFGKSAVAGSPRKEPSRTPVLRSAGAETCQRHPLRHCGANQHPPYYVDASLRRCMPEQRQAAIRHVVCGENVVIYEPANLYECSLGDNVFIGPFVEIQANSHIG